MGLQRQDDGGHAPGRELTLSNIHEQRVEPNLLRACEIWATASEGGWTLPGDGIAAFGCGESARAFNQMIVTDAAVSVDAVRAAIASFQHGRFRLRFRDDLHEQVKPGILG